MRVIVSDTSPIRYLVLIGAVHLLERLYGRILIPEAVAKELQAERTPEAVSRWMQSPPAWIEIVAAAEDSKANPISPFLGAGESSAILLALSIHADLILMDERAGVEEARRLGLTVTGTLGVLARCAERGWISLRPTLEKLQTTNFRVHPRLILEMLQAEADRHGS
jgi:predicted nucleic acid-binding protein